jgi:phosphoglycolate phosphatase-like HAD superfamily hydrolase
MLGDSSSDLLAARAGGIEAIAVLNTPPPSAGPEAGQAWVADMDVLAGLFRSGRAQSNQL